MRNNELLKKAIALFASGVIFVGSASSCSFIKVADDRQNPKPYSNVVLDMKNFNADDTIAIRLKEQLNKDKYLRLKFNEDRPVFIECHKSIDEEQMKIISEVVDYYNDVFSTINENYRFEMKTDDTKVLLSDTVIRVENEKLKESTYGNAREFRTFDMGEGNLAYRALIKMDWQAIKDLNVNYAYYVFLHEMGHVLGLGDVYYEGDHKTSDHLDMTTIMQYGEVHDSLFPNDYAVLQALYSNECTKHDNYEDAVRVVNEKIAQYTYNFYYAYAEFLKEERGAKGELLTKDIGENIRWQGIFDSNNDLFYELSFMGDKCKLTIKNENGDVLERTDGEVLEVNGVMFIRGLYITKASNYSKDYSEDFGMKLMLSIYKENSNEIILRDNLFHIMPTNVFVNHQVNKGR